MVYTKSHMAIFNLKKILKIKHIFNCFFKIKKTLKGHCSDHSLNSDHIVGSVVEWLWLVIEWFVIDTVLVEWLWFVIDTVLVEWLWLVIEWFVIDTVLVEWLWFVIDMVLIRDLLTPNF